MGEESRNYAGAMALNMLLDARRVLATRWVAERAGGSVSVRVGGERFLLASCGSRGGDLGWGAREDAVLVDCGGRRVEAPTGRPLPGELPIHSELLRARREVAAVVHAHPPAWLMCGLSGMPASRPEEAHWVPSTAEVAAETPVYPRSEHISTREQAVEVLAVMDYWPSCLLRGHGLIVTGTSLQEAVIRAVALEALAQMTLQLAGFGILIDPIADLDLDDLVFLAQSPQDYHIDPWPSLLAEVAPAHPGGPSMGRAGNGLHLQLTGPTMSEHRVASLLGRLRMNGCGRFCDGEDTEIGYLDLRRDGNAQVTISLNRDFDGEYASLTGDAWFLDLVATNTEMDDKTRRQAQHVMTEAANAEGYLLVRRPLGWRPPSSLAQGHGEHCPPSRS